MRLVPLATLLLTSVSLGACAPAWKPPEISCDDTPRCFSPTRRIPCGSCSCPSYCPCRDS
jgi:hypothetical protein